MRGVVCLAALAALAGCAHSSTLLPVEAAEPGWIEAAFEMNSWGQPVTSWAIRRDGTGTWTKAEPFRGKSAPVSTQTHAVTVPAGGLAQLQSILARLPDPAPAYDACRDKVTDMPYGKLTLSGPGQGGAKEVAYNAGCLDPDYRAFMATLKEADALVANWGRAGPLVTGAVAQAPD